MKRAYVLTYDVFVSNFNKTHSNDVIEKKISKHFTQFGETKGIFVRENSQGKFGVVKYLSEPDADRAVSESNGILLDGLPILVRRMERKPIKSSGAAASGGIGGGGMVVTGGGSWSASKDGASKTQLGKNPDIVPAVEPAGSASPGPEGEMMLVTFVETPTMYWCQDLSDTVQLEVEQIRTSLAEVCPNAPTLTSRPEPGKIYGAKFSEDGEWYRCQLKNTNSVNPERVKIQYVDYGNCEDVRWKELVDLPADLATLNPFAQKIMLHNTRYISGKEKEAKQYLEGILSSQHSTVCPTFRLPDGTGLFAQVYTDTTGNLNQHLIDMGYAVVKPPKQQQQSQSPLAFQQQQQQQQNETSQQQSFHLGDGGGYGGPMGPVGLVGEAGGFHNMPVGINRGLKGPGPMPGRQVLGEAETMRSNTPRFGSPKPGDKGLVQGDTPASMGTSLMGSGPGLTYPDLRIELLNKQRALDLAREELATEHCKMKGLQNEFQGLVTRMEENNIVNQLKMLISMVKKVRQLRSQFSWDQPTALDKALDLACNGEKVTDESITSLPPLMTTLTTYRSLQEEICNLDNVKACPEKLKERDELRKTLYQQLCDCLTEMDDTPITERANSIMQCTENLLKNYESYILLPVEPCPDFNAAVAQYRELKAKKQNDFEQTQLQTDQQQLSVKSMLAKISKSLSISEEGMGDSDIDILKQTKMYHMCLQQEISVRSADDSQESSFLASLVKCVHSSFKREVLGLNKLTRMQKDFTTMRDTLSPWLDNPPSLDTLLENRQILRSLKSKLRHKLADKHDAEENEEMEELEAIQKEVEAIQTEIHNALLVEENELAELAVLVNEHFPEFLTLHPESGLDLQLKYKGIVKSHHEISHYNLTPIPGANGRLFFSKFASKDIIVRECLLSDGHHMGQEEFLVQLMTYIDVSHPALLQPTTIFFDKKSRHAYICVEKGNGDILSNCVQYGSIRQGDGQSVVKCIAEALVALHARKVLHGEINPFNILRFPDGSAKLLPPDFSCSPTDRARNKQTVSGGLSFTAPELNSMPAGSEATGVVDMYSLGILILYLSCGVEGVPLTADGSLDISKLQLEPSACGVVKNLLSKQPALRPTADLLLISSYLRSAQSHDTPGDRVTPPPAVTAVSSVMSSAVPSFVPALMQHRAIVGSSLPMMPPINLQQPPPPLPPIPYSHSDLPPFATPPVALTQADTMARFSTPPPVESFSALSVTDPNSLSKPGRNPAVFSAPARGDHGFEAPISTFEAGAGDYLPGGFEEAAIHQEQQEIESRGPLPTFQGNLEPVYGDQGHFEIGTFSIQEVNGSEDATGSKGRKITRQPSAEDEDKEEGEDEWPVSDSSGEA